MTDKASRFWTKMSRVTQTVTHSVKRGVSAISGGHFGSSDYYKMQATKKMRARDGSKLKTEKVIAFSVVGILACVSLYLLVSVLSDIVAHVFDGFTSKPREKRTMHGSFHLFNVVTNADEYGSWELSHKEVRALDKLIIEIFQHHVDENIEKMEESIHRASQTFCVPYLKDHIALNHRALGNLESEMVVLIDMIGKHRENIGNLDDEEQTIIVDSDGRISFVNTAEWERHTAKTSVGGECPLVTELFELTRGNLHINLPKRETENTVEKVEKEELEKQEKNDNRDGDREDGRRNRRRAR
jgi:hypothetical protein